MRQEQEQENARGCGASKEGSDHCRIHRQESQAGISYIFLSLGHRQGHHCKVEKVVSVGRPSGVCKKAKTEKVLRICLQAHEQRQIISEPNKLSRGITVRGEARVKMFSMGQGSERLPLAGAKAEQEGQGEMEERRPGASQLPGVHPVESAMSLYWHGEWLAQGDEVLKCS